MEIYLLVAILALVYLLGLVLIEDKLSTGETWIEGLGLTIWPVVCLVGVLGLVITLAATPFTKAWDGLKAFDQWLIRKVWGF